MLLIDVRVGRLGPSIGVKFSLYISSLENMIGDIFLNNGFVFVRAVFGNSLNYLVSERLGLIYTINYYNWGLVAQSLVKFIPIENRKKRLYNQ